jgi:hypothetical protein
VLPVGQAFLPVQIVSNQSRKNQGDLPSPISNYSFGIEAIDLGRMNAFLDNGKWKMINGKFLMSFQVDDPVS